MHTAAIYLRFLRVGCLAWGGPVAHIAELRAEFVEGPDPWVGEARFDRMLAVYQAMPGPEATELCVHLGQVRGGRRGGLAAGLGFLTPGVLLVLLAAWAYVAWGVEGTVAVGVFAGCAPVVAALVLRAVWRLGARVLRDRWLVAIGIVGAATQLLGAPFLVPLVAGGLAAAAASRGRRAAAYGVLAVTLLATATSFLGGSDGDGAGRLDRGPDASALVEPSSGEVAAAGLRAGALTFGGAYTAIPYVEHDAVREGRWVTQDQFLDGLAISSIVPSPLVVFATFVGYLAGGLPAALIMTVGIFLPAFALTLLGHRHLERLVAHPRLHAALDGVTAAVLGLMAVTAGSLAVHAVSDVVTAALLPAALLALAAWQSRLAVPAVMAAGALLGAAAHLAG